MEEIIFPIIFGIIGLTIGGIFWAASRQESKAINKAIRMFAEINRF